MVRRWTILARGIALLGALLLLNVVLWVITAIVFSAFQHRIRNVPIETTRAAQKLLTDHADDAPKRSGSLLSFALVAWTTGLRHALDADHISAIDNATRRIMAVPHPHAPGFRRPVTVGLFFSLGHSTIVVAVLIAIAVSFTVFARMDKVSDVGGIIGASVSGSFLFVIGVINTVLLARSIHALRVERRTRRTGDAEHALCGVPFAPTGPHMSTSAATPERDQADRGASIRHSRPATPVPADAHEPETAPDVSLQASSQVAVHPGAGGIHKRVDHTAAQDTADDAARPTETSAPPERPVAFRGLFTRLTGPLLRAIDRPWKMYPIGILFGLGFDTASTISLLAIAVIASSSLSGSSAANGSVVLLAFLFTAAMSFADSCDAVLMVCAYAWEELQEQPKWYALYVDVPESGPHDEHDLARAGTEASAGPDMAHEIAVSTTPFALFLTALSIVIAFAVSIIELLGLIGDRCAQCSAAADRQSESHDGGLAGRWWLWWRWCNDNFGWIGIGITGVFFVSVAVALAATIYVTTRQRRRRRSSIVHT